MSIADLTPEESHKAGIPIVLALEAGRDRAESLRDIVPKTSMPRAYAYVTGCIAALNDALALVTAKDADRGLD